MKPATKPATKIVIVGGAGGIGSSVAFNLVREDLDAEVVLVDTRPESITSHTMDLEDIVALGGARRVRGGDTSDLADADVVVISAAVPLRANTSRMVFLHDNAAVLRDVVAPLAGSSFHGTVMVMTNPVDPLVTWVHELTGLPRQRVVGYTLNDSLRFRFGISDALGVRPQRVDAWVIGEHGEHQVPLYSRVRVDGEAVSLTPDQRAVAQDYMDNWYVRHVALNSGRTSTWSSGLGGARMVRAIATGQPNPFPASVMLDGEYGLRGVSVSVPAVLARSGVVEVVEWDLDEEEASALAKAARVVQGVTDELRRSFEQAPVAN